MHVDFDVIHRDDSDSEEEGLGHGLARGWEDRVGAIHYPEENVTHALLISSGVAAQEEQEWHDVEDLVNDGFDYEDASEVGDTTYLRNDFDRGYASEPETETESE